jgi:DNA repair exonuclease SbcCD ATPase subunit
MDEVKEKYVKIKRHNQNKPIVVYSGSMIQQNHGEKPYGHGYALWDLPTREHTHHEVHNDYGYYTIEVRDGECVSDLSKLPKKARLRVKVYNTTATETKEIIADIRKRTSISDLNVTRCDAISEAKKFDRDNKFDFGDISLIQVQNELIEDYLRRNFVVEDDQVQTALDINKEVNDKLVVKEVLRNCIWKPKKFEFGNMFSYGDANVVDFTNMKSVMGLFASNASGKSSVMSALSFCLFDKCDRAFKAAHVLNTQTESFYCKLNFEISGVNYYIDRTATTKKNGDVTVVVDFWKLDEDGQQISLNGEQRAGTNASIRDHVGSYDDFVLTTLSLQNNNAIFIDKSQSERKDLLAQFMGIDTFDQLHTTASEDIKEINALLKRFNREDFDETLANVQEKLEGINKQYTEQDSVTNVALLEQKKFNKQLVDKNSQFKNCSFDEKSVDIDKLEFNKKNLKERLGIAKESRDHESDRKRKLTATRKEKSSDLLKLDGVDEKYVKVLKIREDITLVDKDLAVLRTSVNAKLDKLKQYDCHEYDPNCKFCVTNSKNLIESAEQTKIELDKDKAAADELVTQKNELLKILDEYKNVESEYELHGNLKNETTQLTYEVNEADSKVLALSSVIESLEKDIVINDKTIEEYHECRDSIEFNKKIQIEVNALEQKLLSINKIANDETAKLQTLFGEVKIVEKEHEDILASIEEAKGYERKKRGYELYLDAVKRDGISYELISKTIPSIESEVNNILSQIVDFGMQLEMDGKHIYSKITYEDRHWPLEMCSGMERFISSIAMRVALINVSSLPRSNFLVIDEGWGSLDGDNISSVFNLFTYLKGQFEFIMVISHLDVMRDMVDEIIEIQKEGSFSKIKYGA